MNEASPRKREIRAAFSEPPQVRWLRRDSGIAYGEYPAGSVNGAWYALEGAGARFVWITNDVALSRRGKWEYDALLPLLKHCAGLVLIDHGGCVGEFLHERVEVVCYAGGMCEAVLMARALLKGGGACVFAPLEQVSVDVVGEYRKAVMNW